MTTPLLVTKLYIPPPRPGVVLRPRLLQRLNEGLVAGRQLTLISAPAGFGKTTLVSTWIDDLRSTMDEGQAQVANQDKIVNRVAWLSLDEGDSDPARFLTYLVAALQTVAPHLGAHVMRALQSPQPPPSEPLLTTLLNEVAALPSPFVLVLDDYHLIEAKAVDAALAFLIERLPPTMRLVIATREDPDLPLARWRVRGQLTELRAADLRFSPAEAAEFLHSAGLHLAPDDITALEERTEGWIAGLQLAALSMQGHPDAAGFIHSFTGSHHFVMDYLAQEVLRQQPAGVQTFLLRTSILDRLCGPLCDALLDEGRTTEDEEVGKPSSFVPRPSSHMLEYLERANLFIVALDNERRWFRYHHLFADLLRQRLRQTSAANEEAGAAVAELHRRASQWYEDQGLNLEAFHHAVKANDVERAERLIDGQGIPLHMSGAVTAILDWLASLPTTVLNARPWLWWRYASLLLMNGQTTGVEEKLQASETALQHAEANDKIRYLVGQIAAARATLALTRYDVAAMLVQSRRALEHLPPTSLSLRANAHWTLAYAYFLQGDRVAGRRACTEAIRLGHAAGAVFTTILATIGLGNAQEGDNELHQAAATYRHVLQLASDQPLQIIYEAHLGLARVLYEWNDLDAAEQHGRQSLALARQYDQVIDRFILCEVFLARLRLARGDVAGAAELLAQAAQTAQAQNFVHRLPDVAAAHVPVLLRQGQLAAAAHLAQTYHLPLGQARVYLAQGDSAAALAVLEAWRQQVATKGWHDERLRALVLQALALHAHQHMDSALRTLGDALDLAAPGGFTRLFVDEGPLMAQLLAEAGARGIRPDYVARLLAAFGSAPEDERRRTEGQQGVLAPASSVLHPPYMVEPLSQRELEVLRLIAQGLSNDQIGERLFLALSTVKGHTGRIFGKLGVQRRTEAVARAHELGLL